MAKEFTIAYDEKDLRNLKRAFKNMDDEAKSAANKIGVELAALMVQNIQRKASGVQQRRIAETGRVSKKSNIGEFMFGYARQGFSGGADTRKNSNKFPLYGSGILAGVEFGSNRYPQFQSRNKKGYFIFSTLSESQREIVDRWEKAVDKILKEWN